MHSSSSRSRPRKALLWRQDTGWLRRPPAPLESALATLKAKCEADEVVKLVSVPGLSLALVVVTGAGKVATSGVPIDAEAIRRAVGSATRQLSGLAKRSEERR